MTKIPRENHLTLNKLNINYFMSKKHISLNPPIVNACGILSYLDVFERLEKMNANFGAWIPKSIGPFEKQGNPNPTIYHNGSVLLNSFALPTHSIQSWIKEFESADLKKPVIGSVWGTKIEDYRDVIKKIDKYVSAWEINVSCPNKEAGEKSLMESMTEKIKEIIMPLREVTQKPIIAKLSPNEDYVAIAKSIVDYVDYIACGNTLGPGLAVDIYSRKPILAGFAGGMSGEAIKPKAMKMVNDVYKIASKEDVKLIAYGGISKWEDILEYAIAGASIFGIGTSLLHKDAGQVAKFVNNMWKDVLKYIEKENISFDEIVGCLDG